jgi:hypothetical protein
MWRRLRRRQSTTPGLRKVEEFYKLRIVQLGSNVVWSIPGNRSQTSPGEFVFSMGYPVPGPDCGIFWHGCQENLRSSFIQNDSEEIIVLCAHPTVRVRGAIILVGKTVLSDLTLPLFMYCRAATTRICPCSVSWRKVKRYHEGI